MKEHKKRKHTSEVDMPQISSDNFHPGVCVDSNNGIYLVSASYQGMRNPIHVQKLTTANVQRIECPDGSCKELWKVAASSDHPSYECAHVQSIKYCNLQAEIAEFVVHPN